jgi:hypothetical protein
MPHVNGNAHNPPAPRPAGTPAGGGIPQSQAVDPDTLKALRGDYSSNASPGGFGSAIQSPASFDINTLNPDFFNDARILGGSDADQKIIERTTPESQEVLQGQVTDTVPFIEPTSEAGATARLAPILAKITDGGFYALSPQELADYQKLNKWISDRQELGGKNQSSNDTFQSLMTSILPTLFRQRFEQNELDRTYDQDQQRYRDGRLALANAENREREGRQGAFNFMKTLFPDIDLSGAGGELDMQNIPQLIQLAMSQASIKANRETQERSIEANKQNQVMAQPRIQFAV